MSARSAQARRTLSLHQQLKQKDGIKRSALAAVIAELQAELHSRQEDLEDECERNHDAKTNMVLLKALALATSAAHKAVTLSRKGAAPAALDADTFVLLKLLSMRLQALGATLCNDSSSSGGCAAAVLPGSSSGDSGKASGQKPTSSGSGAVQAGGFPEKQPGKAAPLSGDAKAAKEGGEAAIAEGNAAGDWVAVPEPAVAPAGGRFAAPASMDVFVLLRSTVAACDPKLVDPSQFVPFWHSNVCQLALLLHNKQMSKAKDDQLLLAVHSMTTRVMALCLSSPAFFKLHCINIRTGDAVMEWSQEAAQKVVRFLDLTKQQALALALLRQWWLTQSQSSEAEMEAAHAARAAPHDLALQARLLAVMEERLRIGRVSAATALLVTCALLAPAQVAEIYVQSWPCFPDLGSILDVLHARWRTRRHVMLPLGG